MLNARIRKTYLNNRTNIYSIGDQGDLTYPYKVIGNTTGDVSEFFEKQSAIYNEFKKAKKPLIILGYSFFLLQSAKYLLNKCKEFLNDHKSNMDENWIPLNIISKDAANVGGYDLKIVGELSLIHI